MKKLIKQNSVIAILFLLSFYFQSFICCADVVETVDDIYVQAETNGIAIAICKAIDIGKLFMVPLFAIMFCIYGFRAFQGDGAKWSTFITFALGIAAFNSAGTFLEWFMPKMGLSYGCNCAVERDIRDTNGVVKTYPTGLNSDCTSGMADYYSLHGLDNGGIISKITEKKGELLRLETIVSTYENLFKRVNNLADQANQKHSEVNKAMTDYNNYQQIVNAYGNTDIIVEYNKLLQSKRVKQSALDSAENALLVVQNEVKSINSRLNNLQNQITLQEKAVVIAKQHYDEANSTLTAYKNQGTLDNNTLKIFENIFSSAKTLLNKEENSLSSLKNQQQTIINDREAIITRENEDKTKVATAKSEYNEVVNAISFYEAKTEMKMYLDAKAMAQNRAENYTKLQNELATIVTNYQVQKKKLDDMSNSYQDAKAKIPSLQIEIAELSNGNI